VRVVVPTTLEERMVEVTTVLEERTDVEIVEAEEMTVEETGVPAPERYQLATGSPRHSPTVTAL